MLEQGQADRLGDLPDLDRNRRLGQVQRLGGPKLEEGIRYAKAGIMLTDLRKADEHQTLDMFRHAHEESRIAELLDRVQRKTGREVVGLGYAGIRPGPSWQMKRAMLTRRATTHWEELAIVRA